MEKAIKIALITLVAVIVSFVGTFGTFVYLKERWCANQGLYSPQCYTTYQQFLSGLL